MSTRRKAGSRIALDPPELARVAIKRGIVESKTAATPTGCSATAAMGMHVMSTDEKTGMQALARLHATKPVRPGLVEHIEFGYVRHGTLSRIAHFDVATGRWQPVDRTDPNGS